MNMNSNNNIINKNKNKNKNSNNIYNIINKNKNSNDDIYNTMKSYGTIYGNIKVTDPNQYFAFTAPDLYPATIFYILKSDLENLKKGKLPEKGSFFSSGGSKYYKNTNGEYGGWERKGYFFKSPEIQSYLLQDKDFILQAVKDGITWFLPKDIDMFIF